MKLNAFKFQDGKLLWLPEYPESPITCVWDSMDIPELCIIRLCECAKEATIHSIAVAQSLASAIEVAPEDREKIKCLIYDSIHPPILSVADIKTTFVGDSVWQPEKDKVYSAECEMEIRQKCQHKGIHNSTCIYRQVARLKPKDEIFLAANSHNMKDDDL